MYYNGHGRYYRHILESLFTTLKDIGANRKRKQQSVLEIGLNLELIIKYRDQKEQ